MRSRLVCGVLCLASALVSVGWIAQGLSSLRGEQVEVLSDDAEAPLPGGLRAGEHMSVARAVAEAVLQRNIFDSRVGPVPWVPPAPPPAPDAQAGRALASAPLTRCAPEIRLSAVVIRVRRPERSLALVVRAGESSMVPLGGAVGEARLLALRPQRAYLEQADGSVCFVSVYLSPEERKALAATRSKSARGKVKVTASKTVGGMGREELAAGIRRVGDHHFTVDGALLDRALANPAVLARGARFKAHKEGGRVVGMRVIALPNSSALRHLGVQRGDVLRTLNGYELATPDGLLSAVALARHARNVTLAATRRGRPLSLQFTVQ